MSVGEEAHKPPGTCGSWGANWERPLISRMAPCRKEACLFVFPFYEGGGEGSGIAHPVPQHTGCTPQMGRWERRGGGAP